MDGHISVLDTFNVEMFPSNVEMNTAYVEINAVHVEEAVNTAT